MKNANEMKYEEAMAELDSILRTIQSDQCDIDRLAELTRRASALLTSCRRRLVATEAELSGILAALEEEQQF